MTDRVTVRVYAGLAFFNAEAAAGVEVLCGHPRSVKDLLESLGVPHPEVDLILVNDEPAGFGRRVRGGDRVAAYPPFAVFDVVSGLRPPPSAPRFVLDVHLGRLTRRLRILGLDCDYRTDRDDAELAGIAVADERILLTRDRGLLMRAEILHGYCPRSDDADRQALEVAQRYLTADELAPFTRCARCNSLLEAVDKRAVAAVLEPHTRRTHDDFVRCAGCGQVYWPGTHTRDLDRFVATVRAALTAG